MPKWVFKKICCIFSEHLFQRTPLGGCLWIKDTLTLECWNFQNFSINKKLVYLLSNVISKKRISFFDQCWQEELTLRRLKK